MIKDKFYSIADQANEPLLPPVAKAEVPFINFSALQNAVANLGISADALNTLINSADLSIEKKNELNRQLFKAEQVLLTKDGLPRRGWYKHALYAPGFFTGYGVKTLPGIREAIEQRNWKEAQEQIEIDAATINNLSLYLAAAAGVK